MRNLNILHAREAGLRGFDIIFKKGQTRLQARQPARGLLHKCEQLRGLFAPNEAKKICILYIIHIDSLMVVIVRNES